MVHCMNKFLIHDQKVRKIINTKNDNVLFLIFHFKIFKQLIRQYYFKIFCVNFFKKVVRFIKIMFKECVRFMLWISKKHSKLLYFKNYSKHKTLFKISLFYGLLFEETRTKRQHYIMYVWKFQLSKDVIYTNKSIYFCFD